MLSLPCLETERLFDRLAFGFPGDYAALEMNGWLACMRRELFADNPRPPS